MYLAGSFFSSRACKKAIEHYQKALNITIENGNRAGEEKCNTNLGHNYYRASDHLKPGEFYEAYKTPIKIHKS